LACSGSITCGTWTVSGNNIYNNNTANVGIGTSSPNTLFNVAGPSSTYFNTAYGTGTAPLVGQITGGSSGTPISSIAPMVAVTRYEAVTANTEGGQNAALYVESKGNNTTSGSNIAQVNAVTAYAEQIGSGDAVAFFGNATQAGSGQYGAFGGFFSCNATSASGSCISVGTGTANNSGSNQTYAGWLASGPGSFGLDLPATGTYTNAGAILIRNAGTTWDTGLAITNGATSTAAIKSDGFLLSPAGVVNYTYGASSANTACVSIIAGLAQLGGCSSDERLKHGIVPLTHLALLDVMRLMPKNFIFNSDETNRIDAGFVAQDVKSVIPEAISPLPNSELLGFQSTPILAYTVAAFQQLVWFIIGLTLLNGIGWIFVIRRARASDDSVVSAKCPIG
jgi:hypothetical protein